MSHAAKNRKSLASSATVYVLEALIPYTDANLKLSFQPGSFFDDLENISRQKEWQKTRQAKQQQPYKRQSLVNAFHVAKKQGLVTVDEGGIPRLTDRGRRRATPYKPEKLSRAACLMVIFDIPESQRTKRRHLRLLLKELEFVKVQQSVWTSRYDHRHYLLSEIKALDLHDYVQVYECAKIV